MQKQLTGVMFLLLTFQVSAETQSSCCDFWQQVRDGVSGYSAVSGPESNILIQASGTDWLYWRNELISGAGAWGLALMVLFLSVFFLLRGQVKLTEPRSGELIQRWSLSERWLHLYTASLFLLLTFSGLVLLYGRHIYTQLISQQTFAVIAQTAKIMHNYSGPLFIIGLLLMAWIWSKDNLPARVDLVWFKQFGGMVGDQHPSAGRINAGEKAWFWLLTFFGLLISISGLVLDFSNFGQLRYWMQISHILHTVSALLLMIAALGHIYIGSIGTEGALEGMVSGKVDASWARQHHDLWYEALESKVGVNAESGNDNLLKK